MRNSYYSRILTCKNIFGLKSELSLFPRNHLQYLSNRSNRHVGHIKVFWLKARWKIIRHRVSSNRYRIEYYRCYLYFITSLYAERTINAFWSFALGAKSSGGFHLLHPAKINVTNNYAVSTSSEICVGNVISLQLTASNNERPKIFSLRFRSR